MRNNLTDYSNHNFLESYKQYLWLFRPPELKIDLVENGSESVVLFRFEADTVQPLLNECLDHQW